MIAFAISAPGKVILFGEHAVVHGKTAIAVSLDRRTSLQFSELPLNESYVHVELPKLEITEKIPIEKLKKELLEAPSVDNHDNFLKFIKKMMKDDSKISIECFLYALFQVAQTERFELRPFRLKLDSELTIGAGTGSSASFSVCLNAAFLRWSQLQKNPDSPTEFSRDALEMISKYAYNCEKILHGLPSGIDNSICTFGSVVQFCRASSSRESVCKFFSLGAKSLRILLVDTRVGRNTKILVAKVAELLNKYPVIFKNVLECIDEVSLTSIKIFQKLQALDENGNEKERELFDELSVLIDINQGLLSTCLVSHPSLDLICATAKKYGLSAKLTGAGGGGYAYVLIPPGSSNDKIGFLVQELINSGFTVTETNVGGTGVTIHGAGLS